MRNKRMIAAILCGTLLLWGCGKPETGNGEAAGEVWEESKTDAGSMEADPYTSEAAGSMEQGGGNAGEGSVVIETGPEKQAYDVGNVVYTLHDFKLYDSPQEASLDPDKLVTIDAKGYMDRSKFLTVQVDISNIDYEGDERNGEGEMNITLLTIAPNEPEESLQWAGSWPVYLSEPGANPGENGKYYHIWVKPGETKTVTIGFYVPVKDSTELRSQCKISLYGLYEEGYLYDIPEI